MKGTRIIAAVIAGTLTLGAINIPNIKMPQISIVADAASELTYGDFQYTIKNDSYGEYAEITRYIGSDSTIVVPRQIKGIPVKSIGVAAFGANIDVVGEDRYAKDCVQKVTIPEGVTTIKKWAFNECKNLQSISLPDSLETIGLQAFWLCDSLESITIPKNASNPDGCAFWACRGLKEVVFSKGLTEISYEMFRTCTSLHSVTIPDTVTSIGDRAFGGCKNLKEINIPDSVEVLGEGAFYECSSLSNVRLSENLTSIPALTFNGCSIKEITLPYYVSSVGTGAFDNSLEIINISAKLKSVDTLPLNSKSLKAINVPDDNSYYSSENGILYNKAKTILIRFPAALKETEYMAPKTVVTISESAFKDNTNIRNIYLYEKCSSVEPTAFQNCSHLDKIYFYNKNCDIYMSKDTIYEDAVINGYKGSTAEEYADMYGRAFNAITSTPVTVTTTTTTKKTTTTTSTTRRTTTTTYKITTTSNSNVNNPRIIDQGTINDLTWTFDYEGTLTIEGSGYMYSSYGSTPWDDFRNGIKKVVIKNGVTSICDSAFSDCKNLTEITIPNSVTSIGNDAFIMCEKLLEISIPNSVHYIGYDAFALTPWLKARQLENPLVIINDILIDGKKCTGKVYIPNNVTSIGYYAFSGCNGLTEVNIPNSVTTIYKGAFGSCKNLTEVVIPKSVVKIYDSAFLGCQKLQSITVMNPKCVLSKNAIGEFGIIYGYTNSTAEEYAIKQNREFIALEESTLTYGDANVDGIVDLSDAVLIMQSLANPNKYGLSGSDKSHITAQGATNADVEGNNGITANDALTIQKYLLKLISSLPV